MVLADGRPYLGLLTAWMQSEHSSTWVLHFGHNHASHPVQLVIGILTKLGMCLLLKSDLRRKTWTFPESTSGEWLFLLC